MVVTSRDLLDLLGASLIQDDRDRLGGKLDRLACDRMFIFLQVFHTLLLLIANLNFTLLFIKLRPRKIVFRILLHFKPGQSKLSVLIRAESVKLRLAC